MVIKESWLKEFSVISLLTNKMMFVNYKMNLLLIIILIPTLTLQWITKDSTKKHGALSKRIESLSKLTEKIINNYFDGCVLVVLYDETYLNEKIDTIKKLFDAQPRVSYVQKKINLTRKDNNYVVADKCYNYLIFLNDVYDIGKVIGKETINKILIITESTPWTVKDYLRSHPSRFYTNLLIITHSMSRRTEAGSYLLYTHHLYTDGSGASEPVLLTSWIKDHPTDININYYPEKLNQGFKGHRLIVSVAHKPPYTIRKNIINRDIIDWDGIDIRLIKLLSKILNFTAEFRDPIASDSPIYASLTDVKNENSIIATGGIYKTINITNNYDTSLNYMEDCAAFISKSSTALPKYQAVLGPFDPSVWIFVSIIYLLAIIILTINTSYKFIELILKPNILLHMFWYVFSTFTNCFVIKNPLLNNGIAKNATSFLIGFYWIFTIIITSCYTGSIMAFITVPTFPAPIDTAEKLLNEKYTIGTLNHDGWESWFNYTNMTDPIGVRLLKSINYVSNINDGIKNTSKAFFWPYAFLGSKLTLEYIAQDKFPPNSKTMRSSMHISKNCFINFGVTFVLQKNSIYTESINKIIIRARQSGLTQKIIKDIEWDIQRTAEGRRLPISDSWKTRKLPTEDRKLQLDDTQGMFLILICGILIGCLSITIELICYFVKKKKFNKIQVEDLTFELTTSENYLDHLKGTRSDERPYTC